MLKLAGLVVTLAVALSALWYSHSSAAPATQSERSILFYQDPMHPAYRSDKPGIAPDCGMKLVPVYADSASPSANVPAREGIVHVDPENQQRIGLKVAAAEVTPGAKMIRLFGRVSSDESRLYRVNGPMDGWIRSVQGSSLGDHVKKDQILATYYTRELRSATQSHFLILDRLKNGEPEQIRSNGDRNNLELSLETLRNLGMNDIEIREIEASRVIPDEVVLRSPADGFILARNVSVGQRFDRGEELFRISDLRRVWILAAVLDGELAGIGRGAAARVFIGHSREAIPAVISESLPQFDTQSQTLKLRLEADNPNFVLKPDMFVDVEVSTRMPGGLTVPAEAVLDSGLSKTVFLDLGNGDFQAQTVETGWRSEDRIQIVKGLQGGQKVVVSGHFLIDSEARMKMDARH